MSPRYIALGFDQFRDPEIEQFCLAVSCDENVRGLEVAVDDKLLVCKRNRRTYLAKQVETLIECEIASICVRDQRRSLNVLHNEERQAVIGRAAIDQMSDIRMFQRCQDLAFGDKAALNLR